MQPLQKSETNRLLGFPPDARLLNINADDFGMCHATNAAIFRSLTDGVVCSTTLMVPCAWALHAMHWLTANPDIPFGVHLTAMNESLLQSYNGHLRVFPALPTDASLVTRFTLAAKGGFLVTSEREAGSVKYVGIKSLLGHDATVINPWSSGAVQVRNVATGVDSLTALSRCRRLPAPTLAVAAE